MSKIQTTFRRLGARLAFLSAALLAVAAPALRAANGTWASTGDSDWGTAANWTGSVIPGSTTDTGNRDIATFNKGSGYQFTVIPDAGRIIGSVTFDQAGAGNAGNYVIGTTDGTLLALAGIGSGTMQIGATLTTPNVTETVNAPLVLYATYQFINSSPEASTVLCLNGGICSGTNAAVQIQLKGTNLGTNTISGVISNGASTVSILKPQGMSSSGTWLLAGTNTYTGSTAVSIGTLIAATDAPSGAAGAFGNSTAAVTVGDSTSSATNNAALLARAGCTIGRPVTVQSLSAGRLQTATLGGANTAGTSFFTGSLSLNRNLTLQCATGGTVEFSTGTWTARDKIITVGSDGNLGTVRLSNTLSTTGGVAVAYGTLAVSGGVVSGIAVASNAVLTGTGRVVTNGVTAAVTVGGGGLLDPGTAGGIGTLSVTGNVAFASSARLAVQTDGAGADLLDVKGNVTAEGPVAVDVTAGAGNGPWLILRATTIEPAFATFAPSGFRLSLKNSGTELWLVRKLGTLISVL